MYFQTLRLKELIFSCIYNKIHTKLFENFQKNPITGRKNQNFTKKIAILYYHSKNLYFHSYLFWKFLFQSLCLNFWMQIIIYHSLLYTNINQHSRQRAEMIWKTYAAKLARNPLNRLKSTRITAVLSSNIDRSLFSCLFPAISTISSKSSMHM